jgi:hypothetical protein
MVVESPGMCQIKVINEIIKCVLLVYFPVVLIYMVNIYQRIGFVSDGASSVVDKNIGTVGQLKNKMEKFKGMTASCSLNCIFHQEALCANSLNDIMVSCKNCDFCFVQVPLTIVNL